MFLEIDPCRDQDCPTKPENQNAAQSVKQGRTNHMVRFVHRRTLHTDALKSRVKAALPLAIEDEIPGNIVE